MFLVSLFLACTSPAELTVETGYNNSEEVQCATLSGNQICDFSAIDKNNASTALSDLYGRPIVLDLSAMWCGPCKAAAASVQSTADALGDVTFLTVLIENEYGNPPTAEDLAQWEASYDITSEPVWGSSREIITQNPIELSDKLYLEGWPTFYFIDSDGELQDYMRGYSESEIISRLQNLD